MDTMRRRILGTVCAASVAAAAAAYAAEPVHYAVCVGVNEYDAEYVPSDNWLRGCVLDACNIWTNITERGEWTKKTAITLLNSEATKAAIRGAITNAAAVAEPGDVFLYMHSSHGGNYGTNDGKDVCICAYDGSYDDWELAEDLAMFKSGVKVVVMVDACHSGGLFKSRSGMRSAAKSEAGDAAASFDIAGRVGAYIDAIRAKDSRVRGLKSRGISSSEIGWLTAADFDQYSWDGREGGKFTAAVVKGWDNGFCDDRPCGDENNYADFYELWNYAKDIATGNGRPGTEDYTQAQCANTNVLLSVTAGWVGSEPPPGPDDPPRFRAVKDASVDVGQTMSFYVRVYAPASAPATLAIAEGDESATLADGVFSFTPTACGTYNFVLSAGNANGVTNEEFAISAVLAWPPTPTIEDAAPEWTAIPVQNAQVGRLSMVDLANFVSGWPTPDIELVEGDATLEGTVLKFTPSATGTSTFSVCASNRLGTANATLSVEVGELAPKKFAVCVGINEYEEISSLGGCVNDAKYMAANLVERGGWDNADVTVLTDERATKSAIRGAISNVVAQAMPGDVFVYEHSSHGGQFNATDDEEEPLYGEDGLDTFLCVHDESYYDNTTAYNDYEIAADLAAFPSGVKVAVIVDACHSGGLFKSRRAAKASAASFDIAGRVSKIIDSERAGRKARGEDVSRSLSADEIGWAVAAEYYEYSYDGGFYHSDKWFTDVMYGEEYFVDTWYGGYYDYPDSYKAGGVFLASATWGWWTGDADTDKDGLCDVHEFWKSGYDFCSVIGEFRYGDGDYNYYPQCTNVTVLQSIELGWTKPEEAYPEIAAGAAPEIVASALAGSADSAVVEHVVGVDAYSAYRAWAQSVKSPGGAAPAGAQSVRESPCAWLSFALGSDALLGGDLADDGVRIVGFGAADAGSGGGRFALEVSVEGVSIGSSAAVPEAQLLANLAEVMSVEGAETPDPNAFDSDGVEVWVCPPVGGRARLEASPPDDAVDAFFFRVKVE